MGAILNLVRGGGSAAAEENAEKNAEEVQHLGWGLPGGGDGVREANEKGNCIYFVIHSFSFVTL